MAGIFDFLNSLPKRGDVTPEELAARRQGYADLYQGGLLARNRDEMPASVKAVQASQDFIPGIGDALALGEAYDAASRGELMAAGLLGTGAAIGLVPGAGDMLARPIMAAGRKASDFADRIEFDPTAFGTVGGNVRLRPAAAPFDMGRGIGDNSGARLSALDSVDLPPHSRPEWAGAAANRTTPYPRYTPKNTPNRMARLEARVADPSDPIRGMFDNYIDRGRKLGGEDWYNTEELRDWFVGELGEQAGDQQWREYMELIGTTSTGAKVPQNIRFASFYRALAPKDRSAVAQLVKDKGVTPAKAAAELGIVVPDMPDNFGYGHIKQRNQAGNVVNQTAGRWARDIPDDVTGAARTKMLQANPKVKGFGNDLLGDDTNIAADMHFMRMLAMSDGGGDFLSAQAKLSGPNYERAAKAIGPRKIKQYATTRVVNGKPVTEVNLKKAFQEGAIKDTSAFSDVPTAWADTPAATEYAAYENMANRVASEYGMTPAQFQASLWMGAGDMTGLADESQGTFMELFRRSLDKRAGERGISRRKMAEEFINDKAVLGLGGLGLLGTSQYNDDRQKQGLLQ